MIPLSKPFIGDAEKQAVLDVLDSGVLVLGPRVAALESAFAAATGARHAIATSSGTTALHIALLAHGIGPGDEVITTPFTFIASVNAILYTGARPIFVDVDPHTMNLDPAGVAAAVTERTRAILPVHLFGHPCDLDALRAIAAAHDLIIVEDAAQALGAELGGKKIGSFGTTCFSLYATKNVTSGEGGMITTNDDAILDRARLLRRHGMREKNVHELLGFNFRMSELHAALGNAQLARLPEFLERRRANAAWLSDALAGVRDLELPSVAPGAVHAWHQLTVKVKKGRARRDAVKQALAADGVASAIFYPMPATRQAHVRARGLGGEDVPVAEQLSESVLSIPVHPLLSSEDLVTIAAATKRAMETTRG
jgi:dTDP-4-amino-4,6-dideoxygalactose transaminase